MLEIHRAPAIEQDIPGVDDAGDAPGEKSVALRDFACVVFLIPLNRRKLGSAGLGVDGIDLLLARVVDEQDRVAAHAVERKVGYTQGGLACDGRVEGIPSGIKNPARGLGGFGFHGGNGGMASANDGAHGLLSVGLGQQGRRQ